MTKITKVSEEQWKEIEALKQKTIEDQTLRIDPSKAQDIANRIWANLNYKNPKLIFVESPQAGILCAAMISSGMYTVDQMIKNPPDFNSVKITPELKSAIKSVEWGLSIWRRSWAAWYRGGKILGATFDEKIYNDFVDWCDYIPWFAAFEDFVVTCDNPIEVHFNENNVLHNESGPSVLYSDGFCMYSIGGVRVDEQIVMRPETQTIDQIKKEENEEVKRIRIDRYGWVRWLSETKSTVVDERRNDIDNQQECLLQDLDGRHILVVSDPSTGRVYTLGVPREINTCEEASNYLGHGMGSRIIHRS